MAQKKRKEEEKKEPQYEFVPPDFDEKDFLEKDIVGTKITMLTFVWGLIFGVLAGVTNPISPLVGLLLLFVGLYLLKFFYRVFRIKIADIDKKGWAGNIIMFSFLFLGTWIMLLNPPFV
jgi:hypothetical protein